MWAVWSDRLYPCAAFQTDNAISRVEFLINRILMVNSLSLNVRGLNLYMKGDELCDYAHRSALNSQVYVKWIYLRRISIDVKTKNVRSLDHGCGFSNCS